MDLNFNNGTYIRCYICQATYRKELFGEENREDVCPSCNYIINITLLELDNPENVWYNNLNREGKKET